MPCGSIRFSLPFDKLLNWLLPVRCSLMRCPELPWPLEHSPDFTLQHVRINRSRLLKHWETRTSDTTRTKLSRKSNFALQGPSTTEDILHTELRSFCVLSDPIQTMGTDQSYDELF